MEEGGVVKGGGVALKRKKSLEVGRGVEGQVVGGQEDTSLELAVEGEGRRVVAVAEAKEGLAEPLRVGGEAVGAAEALNRTIGARQWWLVVGLGLGVGV